MENAVIAFILFLMFVAAISIGMIVYTYTPLGNIVDDILEKSKEDL